VRILHTSDWHLGRNFGQVSLAGDQAAFVEWLLDVVAQEGIELVVIAGDLYDRAFPPVEAVQLFRHALTTLAARGVRVVAIAGNHDSPERVAAADGLTDAAGIVIRGGYARAGHTVTFHADDGPLDVVLVPFLEPSMAPARAPVAGVDTPPSGRADHQSVITDALANGTSGAPRSIVVAHAFVTGGEPSDSERLLSVGSAGTVAASTFAGFSYVALGHLHRPQFVGHHTRRYSGSPLPYSFSEAHPKHVVVVDLDAGGVCRTNSLDIPVGRRVATITGPIDELLSDPRYVVHEPHFVRAVLTDPHHVLDAKARLLRRFGYVTEIVLSPSSDRPTAGQPPRLGPGLSPIDATRAFWRDVTNREATAAEVDALERVLTAAAAQEAAQ